jgi:hypothetical protein
LLRAARASKHIPASYSAHRDRDGRSFLPNSSEKCSQEPAANSRQGPFAKLAMRVAELYSVCHEARKTPSEKFKDTEKVVSSWKRYRVRCTIEVTRRRQHPCLEEAIFV